MELANRPKGLTIHKLRFIKKNENLVFICILIPLITFLKKLTIITTLEVFGGVFDPKVALEEVGGVEVAEEC